MDVAVISFQDNTDIIGAKYIHSYLLKSGFDSHLIIQPDRDVQTDGAILDFVAAKGIRLVGLSIMSIEFNRACEFAAAFKERYPDIPLVFGGIHATVAPEECLEFCDAVFIGESEYAVADMAGRIRDGLDWTAVDNLCYRDSSGVLHRNPVRQPEPELDAFPFPRHLPDGMYVVDGGALKKFDDGLFRTYSRYSGSFLSIITTRGCPFSCTYCCNSAFRRVYDRVTIRKRSVENVIEECLDAKRRHPYLLMLNIQDDCFMTHGREWLEKFSRLYKEKVGIPFAFRTTPRHFYEESIRNLKDAGLRWVLIGLQSGSERINREVFKRNIKIDEFLRVAERIKALGISANYDVILDNPYEDDEDLLKTLDVVISIPKPYQLQLFSLTFYPGTELYARAISEKIAVDDAKTKDYGTLGKKQLNFILELAPVFPARLIKFLAANRETSSIKKLITFLRYVNIAFLMPWSYFRLMCNVYDWNPVKLARVAVVFGKDYRKLIMRKVGIRKA